MAARLLERPGQHSLSSETDSSGDPSVAEFGVKLIAPPLRNEQLSGAAHHKIAFSRDGASSDSEDDLVEVEARQTAPDRDASPQIQNASYIEKAEKNGFRSIELVPKQNVPVQHYLNVDPTSSSDLSSGKSGGQPSLPSASRGAYLRASGVLSDPRTQRSLNESEQLPSIGSALHEQGTCKPCLLQYAPSGCDRGYSCNFCHSKHARKNLRPCKGKRDRFKKLLEFRALRRGSEEAPQETPEKAPLGGTKMSL